jgi:hypothetical protein
VKLDFSHLPDGYVATPCDIEAELKTHRPPPVSARDRPRQHRGRSPLWAG